MSKVTFTKTIETKKKDTLLDCATRGKIKIKAPCKGKGKCGKCLVRIVSGKVNPPTKNEKKALSDKKLSDGWRLACEITDMDNVVVEWPKNK